MNTIVNQIIIVIIRINPLLSVNLNFYTHRECKININQNIKELPIKIVTHHQDPNPKLLFVFIYI